MKRAKTVAEYAIMRWIEHNFYTTDLKIETIVDGTVKITDCNNQSAYVKYRDKGVYLDDEFAD